MQPNHDGRWLRPTAAGNGGGCGGFHLSARPLNSSVNVQNPNIYSHLQNPSSFHIVNPNLSNSSIRNPNFPIQQDLQFPPRKIPSFSVQHPAFLPPIHGQSFQFPPQQFANSTVNNHNIRPQNHDLNLSQPKPKNVFENNLPKLNREEVMERIDRAVNEARKAMTTAGESVSSFKVSNSALYLLRVDSWRSLGVEMQDVPSLQKLMELEGKINAFVSCCVGVRRITTLYDLEVAICQNEGIDHFEDLELGPLLRHPLVLLNFPSSSGATDAFKITTEEIVSSLDDFLDAYESNDVKIDEFLNFIAKKKSVANKEKLGVRIQSLGMYVSFIRDAKRQEGEMLKKLQSELQQKYHHFSSMELQRSDHFHTVSKHADSSSYVHKDFCGKHIRFDSSSSDDEGGDGSAYKDKKNNSSKNTNSSDNVSSCPFPSATEEMKQCGLSKKKRKAENLSPFISKPTKFPRGDSVRQDTHKSENSCATKEVSNVCDADFSLPDSSFRMFISTWKDACKELNMAEVLERMLQSYKLAGHKVPSQRRRMKFLSIFPFVGLLNVAITSMRCGMWDNMNGNWKTGPGFGIAHAKGFLKQSDMTQTSSGTVDEIADGSKGFEKQVLPDTKLVAGNDELGTSSRSVQKQFHPSSIPNYSCAEIAINAFNPNLKSSYSDLRQRDQPLISTPETAQAVQTGRLGEEIAFRYFADKYAEAVVKWVNEYDETGLPYDIVIEDGEGKKHYIEVKATVSASKDWFNLTVNEWQFAYEKGDCFSIAHVLLGNMDAILTQHRNPVKLCREGKFRLVIFMSKQQN